MVESTVRIIDPNVSYKGIHASRGKILRAEPVSALYEQGRVHHVGTFPELEDQLCTFAAGSSASPDRLDALVYALTELLVGQSNDGIIEYYRRLVEKREQYPFDEPCDGERIIKMRAPPGASYVMLMSGRGVPIPEDRIVAMAAEDARPLIGYGWTRVP